MNRRDAREWARIRVDLGMDPENQPPDMDQPSCVDCGVILTRGRGPRCWVCREQNRKGEAA